MSDRVIPNSNSGLHLGDGSRHPLSAVILELLEKVMKFI